MSKPGLAARRGALGLLIGVAEGRLMSEMLPRALERLAPDERARAQRLALTTLRWMDRADRLLGPHLRRRPSVGVMSALRMATAEISVDGAAPHGVVDAAVSLMREDQKTAGAAGMVNAVLRKVAADGPERWDALPVPRLPKWLRGPLVAAWGKPAVQAMEAAHAAGAPLDLTPKDGDAAALAGRLGSVALPTGSVRLETPGQVSALPGYAAGEWWVQDASAALPARVLAVAPGERGIDLCAAPGGKTLQLTATGASVTAIDVSEARLARLRENLARTGLQAETVAADALEWRPAELADAVLLDAPCSATGTIRRHPDLPYARDGSGIGGLIELQGRLIDSALDMVRPGGRLVYCTCSLLPDEGEVQIEEALARHPGLGLDRDASRLPGVDLDWIGPEGIRTRPDFWADRGGIDGFFIAGLRKPA